MNFAHMVGEHHFENQAEQWTHVATSWIGFVASVIVGGIICYVAYKRYRKTHAKQEIDS